MTLEFEWVHHENQGAVREYWTLQTCDGYGPQATVREQFGYYAWCYGNTSGASESLGMAKSHALTEITRQARFTVKQANQEIVWARPDAPFSGEQVAVLLDENEKLKQENKRMRERLDALHNVGRVSNE